MERDSRSDDRDPAKAAKQEQMRETENIRYAARLGKRWQGAHSRRVAAVEGEFLKASPAVAFDEKLLINLISHDFALCEILGESEVQLARRIAMMVDNARVALALAKALRETSLCRGATERRLQELMQTRSVLHGQRKLAEIVPLRRVA